MPNLLYNYIFVSLHFTFSAFPMIIQISVSRFRFVNALSIATLLPSLRGKHYFHPLLLSLVGSVSLYALRHYYHPPFLLLSLWRVKKFRHGYIQIFKLSHVNFHPPDRVQVRENKDWVMHLFFKKFAKKKKKIGHLVGNWKKSGPQSRNHVSKISRFRVTGQKPKSKKGPKSQITRQKKFSGSSRWYQPLILY